VYENVQIPNANFCIGARSNGEFCTVVDGSDVFIIRSSTGTTNRTCSLSTGVNEIKSLEYTGPRGIGGSLDQLGTNLPFFTLERDTSSGCTIREWRLNAPATTFTLYNTITKTNTGSYYYDCNEMAVEYHHTTFVATTTTGTGHLHLTSSSGIEINDRLLLGPSGDTDNLFAYEWVVVTNVVGNDVYITGDGLTPPHYEYVIGDDVTFYKYLYLFSDIGQGGDTTKGSLYKLTSSGAVVEVTDNAIYSGVRASAWSLDYNALGFVKGNNIVYVDPTNDYQIQRSQVISNVDADDSTFLSVYDLIFDGGAVYRLQDKITLVNDAGVKSTTSWATYNYHQDVINPYPQSINIDAFPDGIMLNDESHTLTTIVRDQFGVGLNSKTVTFTSTEPAGYFTPLNGQVITNASGISTILYHSAYYNPASAGTDLDSIIINTKTDGASPYTGSQYVNDQLELTLFKKFTTNLYNLIQKPTWSGGVPTSGDLYTQAYLNQTASGITMDTYLKSLTKFQFPGGDWIGISAPSSDATTIKQMPSISSIDYVNQISSTVSSIDYLNQDKEVTDTLQLSQLYISKHSSTGHKSTTTVAQFQFIEDAVPAFWSEKNPVNTTIWIRLRPYAFSLNQSTLVFKVKEISYNGDTGYIDVTSSCVVTTFDAGGGLLGLDILYTPAANFHYNGVVYVSLEVYDVAPTPNIILTDYWFRIIPDYKAPYIDNEYPAREATDVSPSTNISFDIHDAGIGVDIDSLEFYVNNRIKHPTTSGISDGFHVEFDPDEDFYFGETIGITVKALDSSVFGNTLYDMWRFYCIGSTGPWIDPDSFVPRNCTKGSFRRISEISFNVYGIDNTGVDQSSIIVHIGGKERNVSIIPIIYRID
jgi:hypothetical protein